MATEEMITSLPTVASATMSDIIYAVQGYSSPSSLGLSVQETFGQVFSLFQSNMVLVNSGNPNGVLAGTTYQFCWDQTNSILYICIVSGTSSTAVWERANINSGFTTTPTAAATTTLTVLSTYWQFFTGATTQTVVMPVASTCAPGMSWYIVNNSTGALSVQSSGLNVIASLASGQVAMITCILNSGTSAASWNAIVSSVSGGVTSITGTTNQVNASFPTGAVTLSLPQDIAPASSPTFNALTLTNPLPIASGGTSSSTVITNPTATRLAGWDANKNLSANNFIPGYTTTSTAAGVTVFTVGSTYWQFFTGGTTQTVTLPVTSTLVLGQAFEVINNSTGVVTVQSSGGNTVTAMAGGTTSVFTCILTSGTTAASWNSDYSLNTVGVASITGTANQVIASASTGAVTLSLPQSIGTTSTPTFSGVILPNSATAFAGLKAPTVQKFLSGSGTYTTPTSPAPLFIQVMAVGGGGGGGGSGTTQTTGGNGGNTTFGSSLISATGGTGAGNGAGVVQGGAGGGGSLGTAIGSTNFGSYGSAGQASISTSGGSGGNSIFGGSGAGAYTNTAGGAANTNSGGGGGGGGAPNNGGAGAGGGGGGFVNGIINSPAVSYAYSIGTAGTAGTAGASGFAGGAGGSGQIVVYEFYQ